MVMIFCNEQVTMSTSSRVVLVSLPATATTSHYVTCTPHQLEQDPNSLDTIIEQALQIPGFRDVYISVMKGLAPLATAPDGSPTLMSMRMERGVSGKELAQALGVSEKTLCDFENGHLERMTCTQASKLAEFFKCDISILKTDSAPTDATFSLHPGGMPI